MADKDAGEPSLELPSLSLRRKRRSKAEPPPPDPPPPPREVAPSTREVAPSTREVAPSTREVAPAARASAPGRSTGATSTAALSPDEADEADEHPEDEDETGTRRRISLPALGGLTASLVTGALVGVLTVGLTWAGFGLCEVVQGTSSCGDPGFLLLLAIMVAMVVLGAVLLRAWDVSEAGSISLLAVGLMAVVALLFLIDLLFSWWMVLVIPLVAMTTFALAHGVTTAVTEPTDH